MKFLAKNSVHSKSHIQKNILGRFFGGSKNIVFKTVLLAFGLVSMLGSTHALFNGTVGLDLGFNTGSPIEFNDYIRAFAEQSDGKILVGGAYTTFNGVVTNDIIRLNADGTRDTSFNIGAGFNSIVYVIKIQDDGKILMGGQFTTYQGVSAKYMVRLNTDGSRDTSFDMGAGFNGYVYAVALQTDGKIIAGGNFTTYSGVTSNRIIRLDSGGTLDSSFMIGLGFDAYIYPNAIALQTDGKIVIGGLFTTYSGATASKIIRLNTDGIKDSTFVVGGGFNDYVCTLAIQDDGKILAGGAFSTYSGATTSRIARLNTDGSKDTSFLSSGMNTIVYNMALQTGGKIVAGGSFVTYNSVSAKYIVGLNADGTRDATFNVGVGLDSTAYSVYVQRDGKVLIGGVFTQYDGLAANKIIRLNADATKDMTFTMGNGLNAYVITQAIQNDGKIIIGGAFTTYSGLAVNRIARLNTNGTLDSTFNIGVGFNEAVRSIVLQSDGKIIVGGAFTSYNGATALRIVRLNTDGTKDATFSAGGANSTIYALAIQTGDKIIAGGDFTNYSGVAATNYIVGLNADGTRDASFTIGLGFNGYVYALAVQSDGKILVGGNAFTTYQGVAASRIVRLNTDGSRDTSFLMGGGFNALVSTFAIQPDDEILVGGTFTTYSGATAKYVARLATNGLLDTGFLVGASFNTTVRDIALQSDGKILAGGSFTAYSGVTSNRIIRLNADGTKDPTFSIGAGFDSLVYTLGVNNGRISVGGEFASFDGQSVGYFTQLYEIQPPTLISPLNGDFSNSTSRNFLRNPSTESGVVGYVYQVSTNSGFSTFTTSGTTTQTGISLNGFAEGLYYRRVAAYDNVGNTGLRSDVRKFLIVSNDWDNSQFLTGSFRESNPSDTKIIYALFDYGNTGTGRSAYTQNRNSVGCSFGAMVVTGVSPGTDTLPVTLATNTIYLLESGTYITTATRNMETCSAIIGKGTVEIKANFITNTRLINSTSKTNRILDNLLLNRNRGTTSTTSMDVIYTATSPSISFNAIQAYSGYVGIYANGSSYTNISNAQSYTNLAEGIVIQSGLYGNISNTKSYSNVGIGIYFYIGAHYGTVNNSKSYNNGSVGIYFNTSNSGTISNSQSYNNTNHGIYANTSNNTQINNTQSYNNSSYGINILTSNNTQINNSQSYNNNSHGIYTLTTNNMQMNNSQSYNNNGVGVFFATSNYSSINNSQIYNNSFGVQYSTASNSGIINNSQIYNQANQGIYYNSGSNNIVHDSAIYNIGSPAVYSLVGCANNKYYGTIYMFGNSSNIGGTAPQTFFSGTDGLMGRSDGTIQTPTLSRDYITNPVNLSGDYFFLRTGTMTSLRGRKTTSVLNSVMQYSYGSGTLTQVQPIIYSGITLITSGVYNPNNYIGGNIAKTTGEILGINQYNGVNSVITGIGNLPISTYTIYGNIQNILGGIPINTATTIQLTTGSTTNTLIAQFYDPINYFATHFQKITTIDQTPPSVPTLLSPTSGTQLSTGILTLVRGDAIDTGAGIGGYSYQVSTTSGFTSIYASGSTITTGTSLTGFTDGLYYRRISAYDSAGNTGARSSGWNFIISIVSAPQVGTAYILSGTTGDNGGIHYYKGIIDVRAYLSGSAISVCEYTTGTTRASADIQAGYCEVQNLSFNNDIVVQFRASNEGGTTTGGSTTYIYDATPPSGGVFTINNNAAYTTGTNVVLTTTCATDTGINSMQVAFGSSTSPTNRQSCSSNLSRTLPSGDGTKTVYMRFKDSFENISEVISDTIILDTNGPSSPILLSPIHGLSSTTGSSDLLRSGSVDAGVGLSGYIWQLSTGSNFATLISGGSTTTTGVSLSGLAMTTYYRRVYAVDNLGNTGSRSTGRSFTIAPAITFDIESPASLDLGSLATPEETQIVEKTFTGSENYFVLSDYVGDDQGYYTTLSMTNMTNGNGALLSNQNIAIKTATNIVTIAGSSNPNVVSAITGSYRTFGNDVLTFIKRDPGSNGGLMGTYGVSPALKVTIPQLQNSGNYSGTLIYTIYPN